MKRWIALMLALLGLALPAAAETRENVIYLEGEPEPVVETLCDTGLGFSFWYDAELLEADVSASGEGARVRVCPVDSELPVWLELLTPEAAGALPWRFLEMNAEPDAQYEEFATESGDAARCFSRPAAHDAALVETYYAVEGAEDFVVAVACCPLEAEEGWGRRFQQLMRTVAFDAVSAAAGPVSAVWAGDAALEAGTYDACIVLDDGLSAEALPAEAMTSEELIETYSDAQRGIAWAMLLWEEPVADFRLLALELAGVNDAGNAAFDAEELFQYSALTPDRPLLLGLTFPGDIPSNGIAFTGADAVEHRYSLSVSGLDGSLVLAEF